MKMRSWAVLRTRRTSRSFSAYLAVVLLTAMIGPGLAVHAAEGEATATVSPDAPTAEAGPEVGSPDASLPVEEPADVGGPAPGPGVEATPAQDTELTGWGCLVIRKYEDLDADCRWDEGEPPLGGWVFTLYDAEGEQIGSGTTDANGWLRFEGVPEGAVCAEETLRDGWTNTTPLCQQTMVAAASSVHLCFGNVRQAEAPGTGDLVVRQFEDLDEDGSWDDGEPALGGWDFTLRDARGALIGNGTTDANGWIMWEGLPEGEVTVTETLEPGWTNTTPLSRSATIVAGETAVVYFGNIAQALVPETGDVIIHAFLDANENGAMDAGEQPLPGRSVTVRDGTGTVVETGTTGVAGDMSFELPAGTYAATEALTSGWANTTPLTQSFTVVVGQTQHVYFGSVQQFLPFTPGADPAPGDPFLPFTGGEYAALVAAALASAVAGAALRRKPDR